MNVNAFCKYPNICTYRLSISPKYHVPYIINGHPAF